MADLLMPDPQWLLVACRRLGYTRMCKELTRLYVPFMYRDDASLYDEWVERIHARLIRSNPGLRIVSADEFRQPLSTAQNALFNLQLERMSSIHYILYRQVQPGKKNVKDVADNLEVDYQLISPYFTETSVGRSTASDWPIHLLNLVIALPAEEDVEEKEEEEEIEVPTPAPPTEPRPQFHGGALIGLLLCVVGRVQKRTDREET